MKLMHFLETVSLRYERLFDENISLTEKVKTLPLI